MKLGIADPPYPGKAYHYIGHPDYGGEVDHEELIIRLEYLYDGWALATSKEGLKTVLAITARHVERPVDIGIWVRGSRGSKSVWPQSCWEAVVYAGGRQVADPSCAPGGDVSRGPGLDASRAARRDGYRRDVLEYVSRPRLTDPKRVIGAKPAAWCRWVFDLLGACAGDSMDDLYPGSGGVTRAWELFTGVGPRGETANPSGASR